MAKTTKIEVQACDNELIIIASQPAGSSVICHLKSGYNAPVSYIVNPSHILAGGEYSLTVVGINWGGPGNFKVIVTAGTETVLEGSNSATGAVFTKTIPMSV